MDVGGDVGCGASLMVAASGQKQSEAGKEGAERKTAERGCERRRNRQRNFIVVSMRFEDEWLS